MVSRLKIMKEKLLGCGIHAMEPDMLFNLVDLFNPSVHQDELVSPFQME